MDSYDATSNSGQLGTGTTRRGEDNMDSQNTTGMNRGQGGLMDSDLDSSNRRTGGGLTSDMDRQQQSRFDNTSSDLGSDTRRMDDLDRNQNTTSGLGGNTRSGLGGNNSGLGGNTSGLGGNNQYDTTSNTTGSQWDNNTTTSGLNKPTMGDKVKGTAEKLAGKVTGNAGMQERGQERKLGEFDNNNNNY
ncbi:unnamed protein product [Mycena citricolor]|uniref:Uncharacterized protein n=1 Tax=Mycena citricolor TaxID=2018698 RepID=A0AAD2H9H1_9AGAR|nr:unnamed protein product [Mycena citricolor]